MPENYIAMFNSPDVEASKKIIKDAENDLAPVLKALNSGTTIPEKKVTVLDKFLSGPINAGFDRFYVNSKKFKVADSCISCGKCEKVCPLDNISMYKGRPIWGNDCTHCMACICKCPKESIEYGRISKGKRRYTCPL